MNILKRYTIPHKGLSNGEHHFDFKVGNAFFGEFEGSPVKSGGLDISVGLTKSVSGLLLDFRVSGCVTVECDRCLDDLDLPVDYSGELKIRISDDAEEYDGDEMWISPAENELELAQYIYESIVLSLPYIRVHGNGKNGKPLCDPDMLARFSIITQEEFDAMEPEGTTLEESPEAEKLKTLKEKLGDEDR